MKILDFYPANCKNCYKCVRNCSVKAIKMVNDQAQIVEEKCIACGKCFLVCPQNARNIHSDLDDVIKAIKQGKKVIVSLAPSYLGVYDEPYKLITALKHIGVCIIEETAIGAQQVTELYKEYINNNNLQNAITTCCPSANMMVQTYYPELLKYLIPIDSPMIAHCKMIRKRHGDDVYIVFLGPCISKKCEAFGYQQVGIINAVISFEELDKWMEINSIDISSFERQRPDLEGNYTGKVYPLEKGIINGLKDVLIKNNLTPLSVNGTDNLKEVYKSLLNGELNNVCIEANSCIGGCLDGPAVPRNNKNLFVRKSNAEIELLPVREKEYINYSYEEKQLDYTRNFRNKKYKPPTYSENDIKQILEKIGKHTVSDELNCGACGYDTCREKAASVIEGLSYTEMCIPYMRSKAEKLSNIIFEYSPNILVITDLNLNILDLNPVGEKIFKAKIDIIRGHHLSSILSTEDFDEAINLEQNIIGKKINLENYGITAYESIIYLPKNKVIFGILNDITNEELKKNQLVNLKLNTIETADKVIEKQMRVAQEIAGLLGETTAETKAALLKLKKIVFEENGKNE
ncbi:MAG: [Fe-Fe] hydrogenase large subunit C-terminal domain-containing protein [Tissierellia bacterium]|nr:[Fe-Fe] hydrogenase large subunit C-terminal domain-containing protein [Tissierellia bacterium]MDD4779647.1 [Fe-Fe] hydrogenase large subunit C-terminal domain-containing protein [Tissierellia bacterium]